jgi:hypothetical protein
VMYKLVILIFVFVYSQPALDAWNLVQQRIDDCIFAEAVLMSCALVALFLSEIYTMLNADPLPLLLMLLGTFTAFLVLISGLLMLCGIIGAYTM